MASCGSVTTSRKNKLRDETALTPQERDPIKADFRNFLYLVWKFLGLPDPTPLQYDIAYFLQHGPRRAVIEAFRGIGKSWITSAFVCWLLYCNPQLKILVVSASKERADNFSTFTLHLINEMPLLRHLRPRVGQRESKVSFDVGPAKPDHAPSVKSVGITGQIAGSRADVVVPDDIEVPNNSDTDTKRKQLSEAVKEFDAVVKPGGRILYLGTPQTEHSVYNSLAERGYTIRIWPSRYPDEKKRALMGARLAPYIADMLDAHPELGVPVSTMSGGAPTDPARFSDEDLLERELSYGRSGYALQFQLDTSLSDAEKYPLKLNDLIVHPLDPERGPIDMAWGSSPDQRWEDLPTVGLQGDRYHRPIFVSKEYEPYEASIMFIDPSGKGKDETAYAILKMLHGRLFLMDIGGFLGGYDDATLSALVEAARRHKVNVGIVEPNFGGGMFRQLLEAKAAQLGYPFNLEDAEWSKVQKEARIIDTLEPVMNQHRLVVCPSVIEKDYRSTENFAVDDVQKYRLFYQMTRITRERGALERDDRLDALAGAVGYCVEWMNRETQAAAEEARNARLEAELERFMDHVVGGRAQFEGNEGRWASSLMKDHQRGWRNPGNTGLSN